MKNGLRWAGIGLATLAGWTVEVRASEQELMEKIKKLEQRIIELEGKAPATGIPAETQTFLGQTKISGYLAGSFFHNFDSGAIADGSQLTGQKDEFMLNQFKLALDKPVDASPDKWDAGYTAHLIFGQDAGYFAFTGLNAGNFGFIEKASLTVNAPVGNGLLVELGRMVTLMGVEVVEPTANPNWTLGNQFVFVEPTTQTGAHFAYKFNDKVSGDFVVFNGWDAVPDFNRGLSFMGRVSYTPTDKTSLALLGFGGPEKAGTASGWRDGVELILTQKLTPKLSGSLQLDYGHEDNALISDGTQVANADWYAAGVWLTYLINDKVNLALRGDYLKDGTGTRTFGVFDPTGVSAGVGPEVYTGTLTLNWNPLASVQVRPELRWDHASKTVFNGHFDQYILGLGVAYLY